MKTYIALLRGVNVGGNKKIAMADLRRLCADIGLPEARTLLQSGNLVFSDASRSAGALEKLLEKEAQDRLGLSTRFFVRGAEEWADVVAHNPFPDAAERDPSHLLVLFLPDAPGAAEMTSLRAAIVGREVVQAAAHHVYAVYPDGIGRSKLTNAVLERALGAPCTGRNWNTVTKLAKMVGV